MTITPGQIEKDKALECALREVAEKMKGGA